MPSFDFRRINCFDNIELFSSENENAYFPFHYHDFFCVSLITNGTEILKNTEQEFIAPAGSISITQINEVHRNYSLAENGYSYKTIYINPAILQYFNNGKPVNALERVINNKQLFQGLSELFDKPDANIKLWENSFKALARFAVLLNQKNIWAASFSLIDEVY